MRTRRLFGLDRSGPKPRETRRGQPLRPLTIPNLVGYVRLAAIPVFLYVALGSDDGRSAVASALYLAISAGDYLDGFLARATGQAPRWAEGLDAANPDWRAVVHTLKGAARGIGAEALGDVCQTAEFGAPEDLPAVLAALEAALAEIAAYEAARGAGSPRSSSQRSNS